MYIYLEETGVSVMLAKSFFFFNCLHRFVLGLAFDTKWMRHRRRFLHAIIGIFFGLASSGIGKESNFIRQILNSKGSVTGNRPKKA